jgi:uncharacterized protein (DUF1330 family)
VNQIDPGSDDCHDSVPVADAARAAILLSVSRTSSRHAGGLWWDSPEYGEIKPIRQPSAKPRNFFVEGVPE